MKGPKMRSKSITVLLIAALCPANLAAQPVEAEKGIWIGNLDLCRSGPVKATANIEPESGSPIVNIVLPAPLREAMAELTTANLGKPLAIRVDGRIVSEPHVHEPITGGEVQISGVDQAEAERIAATLQSCPADISKTAG
jgi:preprotein translocase subunit SecD